MSATGLLRTEESDGVRMGASARRVTAFVLATTFVYGLLGLLAFVALDAYEGEGIPSRVITAWDTGAILQILLYVLGAVAWLVWQHQTNAGLRAMGRQGMRFTPGMSVLWWFVPLANVLFAPQMMQELWRASDPDADDISWSSTRESTLIWVWWAAFIVGNLISRFSAGIEERQGLLFGQGLSAVLVVAAGVLALVMVRGIETRLAALGSTRADKSPEAGEAGASVVVGGGIGAIAGAVAAAGFWVTFSSTLIALGVNGVLDPTLGWTLAIPFGAVIGYLTMLGAGGRGRFVTLAAAVISFFTLVKSVSLVYGPGLATMFADFFEVPGLVSVAVLRAFLSPWWLLLGALAAGGAVAITLPRLPIDLWRIGGKRAPDAGKKADTVAAPEAVVAVPAVVEPAAAGEPQEPIPAPAVADTPPEPEIPAAPAMVAPPLELGVPQAPASPKPSALANRKVLMAGGAVLAVLAIAVAGFAIGRLTSGGTRDGADSTPTPAKSEPAPAVSGPAESESDPEAVVAEMYRAAARGDAEAVRATFASGFDLDDAVLDAWGDPQWEIALVTAGIGGKEGEIKVEVNQTGGGFQNRPVVTWKLRLEGGAWRVSGWFLGKALDWPSDDPPSISTTDGDPAAVDVLLQFLSHRMAGAVEAMKTLATAEMAREESDFFVMESGSFTKCRITSTVEEGDDVIITVEETWDGKAETHDYVLVDQGGSWLVSERR